MQVTVDLALHWAYVARLVANAIARGRRDGWLGGPAAELAPMPAQPIGPADELVRERLGLSPTEITVVWLLAGYELEPRIRHALAQLDEDTRGVSVATLLATVYAEDPARGFDELGATGALQQHELVVTDTGDVPVSRRRVRIADRVLDLVLGRCRLDPALARVARVDDTPAAMLGQLVIADAARGQLREALGGDARSGMVIVQGRSGSGRRSLLAAAVAASGKTALAIDARGLSTDRAECRRQLRIVARECALLDLVPLFRELDALAGLIDLVEAELPELVLATATRGIARRWQRPPRVINVPPLTAAQRASLWKRALPAASSRDSEMLANVYQIAPSLIAQVAAAAAVGAADEPMRASHIEAGVRAVVDDRLAGLATRVVVTQRWDDLVLPDDQATAVTDLLARVRERARVLERWGFADKVGKGLGLVALFSGPPGTGKSLTAGLVAKALGAELYQVDLSTIVSKWIGETEKNLAALFDAAEAGHAMLLFDEADALFGKRTDVQSSNDRHANQEVNYLLQRIETFSGMCILTSNHEGAIDEAFRRRLAVHIRFPLPDAAERKRLWSALLPRDAPVAGDLRFGELAERFELSGGYIRNAVLRAAYLAADEDRAITSAHLARAAHLEYEAIGRVASR